MEARKEMNWEKLQIKFENAKNEDYLFDVGCNVLQASAKSLLCFNKNFNFEKSTSNQYFRVDTINLDTNTTVTLYDKKDGPSELTNHPGNRGSQSIICDSKTNKIYLFGGKNETERLNDLYQFDLGTYYNKLESKIFSKIYSITNPPTARSNHTAVQYKRSMIVFGGWDGTKTLNDMYELSLTTFIWYHINYKSDLIPSGVYRHSSAVIGNYFFIFGGVNEFNEKFNELYFMDFETRKWSLLLASGEYPTPRTFHNFVYIDESINIIGGYSNTIENDFRCLKLGGTYLDRFFFDSGVEDLKINDKNKISSNHCSTEDDKDKLILQLQNGINEIKLKYEAELMKNNCKICYENEINTIILDCYHRFICYDCYFKCGSRCPACKGEIKRIYKTYN